MWPPGRGLLPDDRRYPRAMSIAAPERQAAPSYHTPPPAPPAPPARRRRSRLWALPAVVVGLVMLTRLDLLPSLNPFASETVDRSQPAVLHALEDISQYRAVTGHFEVIIDLEDDAKYLPSFVKGERTLFVAAGTVDGVVDLDGLTEAAISVSDDREAVSILLPRPRLSEPRLDPARSYVFARERGLLDRIGSVFSDNPATDQPLYLLAEERLTAAATEGRLLATAERNARSTFEGMMRTLGFEQVTVTFR